ncbi:MAG: protein kinase [Myxococcota bacterium]
MQEHFGKFQVVQKIGQGGMARVFRAHMPSADGAGTVAVALKRLGPRWTHNASLVDMFTTEADVGMLLDHRNLVRVYESGLVDGEPYIAMECLAGLDLGKLLLARRRARVPFPIEVAIFVAESVLRALDYVHGARSAAGDDMGMIHRDVTPENIFVTVNGEVKLGDFGVAKLALLSQTHTPLELHGKVRYMSPEVLQGHPEIQGLDLWSLAAVLYEMVTLTPPYGFIPEDEILTKPRRRVAPAAELMPSVHAGLSAILERALHANPRKRYPDALSFWKDLAGLRRTLKVRADSAIASRFVCEVMGIEHDTLSPDEQLDASENFARREQLVSFEQSMTQRIQLVQQRGSRRRYLVGGVVAIAAGVAAALFFPWSGFDEEDGARSAVLGTSISAELATPTSGTVENASFATLVDEAHRLGARGRFRAAMTAYQAAVDLDSDSLDARLGLAEIAFRLRDYPQARTVIDGVLNDVPDEPRALLLNAGLLRAIGHPTDAKAAFQEVVAAAPESDQAAIAAATLERWIEPTDTEPDTEADIPTEVDPDGDVDSDTDTDTDAYPDLDADAVVDNDTYPDLEPDTDAGNDFDDEP